MLSKLTALHQQQMTEMRGQIMKDIRDEISGIKGEISGIKGDIDKDMTKMQSNFGEIISRMDKMEKI